MKRRELLHQAVAASTPCTAAGSRGAGAAERGVPAPRGSRRPPPSRAARSSTGRGRSRSWRGCSSTGSSRSTRSTSSGASDAANYPGPDAQKLRAEPRPVIGGYAVRMRESGRGNGIAAMNTIRSIEWGMTYLDVEQRFREYRGDFSRTVCLGEPPPEVVARARRQGRPPRPVRDREAWRDILRTAPLSVPMPIDHVPEENMTITIDLPYVEVDWGEGPNQDLIRITKSGFELPNALSEPLVIV